MYKPKYKYNSIYYPDMAEFLQELYEKSCNEYLKTNQANSVQEKTKDLESIHNFITYLEDYIVGLNSLGIITTSNVKDILTEVKKIQSISVLPKRSGIYGLTTSDYKIYISPELKPSKYLTKEERTLLYIGHEVGHIIHKMWINDIETYIKNLLASNKPLKNIFRNSSFATQYCMREGIALLDEATVQEVAEAVTYHQVKKQRPLLLYYSNHRIYDGESFKSNFDYYKELEEPAILFGKTLRGIGETKDTSSKRIMSDLAKRSFQKSFVTDIITEYQETPQLEEDLFHTLVCLGRIKDASYAIFGYGNFPDSKSLSKKYLSNLKYLSQKNEDYRPKVLKKI